MRLIVITLLSLVFSSIGYAGETEKTLDKILNENNGFSLVEPIRLSKLSEIYAIPVIKEDYKKKSYDVLSSGADAEIYDTGAINAADVKNNGKLPLFIKAGSILQGKTQNRSVVHSRILGVGEKNSIAIVCVQRSKSIEPGAEFKFDGFVTGQVYVSLNKGQSQVWDSVNNWQRVMSMDGVSTVFTDDAALLGTKVREKLEEVLPKFDAVENEVGLIILDKDKIYSLDVFNHPSAWSSLRNDVIKCRGDKVLHEKNAETGHGQDKSLEKAKIKLLTEEFESITTSEDKNTHISQIESENYLGEISVLDDEVIHIMVLEKQ